MAIASFQFLAFCLIVAILYNAHAGARWRSGALLVANLGFLATFSHSVLAFVPLALFLVAGYLGIRLMQQRHRKASYIVYLVGLLLAFVWLKKYTFLPAASFLPFAYVTVGLSYMFFRVLHMLMDAHQDALHADVTPLAYMNYLLNFTTLVSGPIQRYPDFLQQHQSPVRPQLTLVDIGQGTERIVLGFFKVNVVGLLLSMLQAHAINLLTSQQPALAPSVTGALIAASYPVYLYFNFSGYCDIVIGVARFLRIVLPENFDRPFSTDNFLDFWNHWHITLSTWLRSYLYNPMLLALMRRFPSPALVPFLGVLAFFVTFFLIGVWHGRTSEFLCYGVLLGAGVSINKLYQIQMARFLGKKPYKAMCSSFVYQSVCRGLNFTFFAFYLLWFWSTWKDLAHFEAVLGAAGVASVWALIFLASTVVLAFWQLVHRTATRILWSGQPVYRSRYVRTVWDTGLAFVLVAVMALLNTPAPDIVYKAF
jgi:D-alanyl-lipoteichoic acid acyltransferase DltB (MBOAT superfamily)